MRVASQGLIDRVERCDFISSYTGGVADLLQHAGQVWEMMPGVQWDERADDAFFRRRMDQHGDVLVRRTRQGCIEEIVDIRRGVLPIGGGELPLGIVARFLPNHRVDGNAWNVVGFESERHLVLLPRLVFFVARRCAVRCDGISGRCGGGFGFVSRGELLIGSQRSAVGLRGAMRSNTCP